MKALMVLCFALLCPFIIKGQNLTDHIMQLKFVDPVFEGWAGDPDSVTVRIMPGPPEFSKEDSASIKTAIDMWNATNSRPKFKLIDSGTPQVSITRNDNIPGAAGTTGANPDWTTYESCNVEVDTDDGTPVLNIILHELGHCLGLNDTKNSDDVMYESIPGNDNFSEYDGSETVAAAAVPSVNNGIHESDAPEKCIEPGDMRDIEFPVGDLIPGGSYGQAHCYVESLDSGIYVANCFLDSITESLVVTVVADPEHADGQFYLYTSLMLPGHRDLITFLGTHCINHDPVDPVSYECPMDIYVLDGSVHIDWQEGCTYPYGDKLRSRLLVSGNDISYGLQARPDGDYILNLEPGEYTFTLKVNDFQVNTTSSVQSFLVTGIDNAIAAVPFRIGPNPFSDRCSILLDKAGRTSIFDVNGKIISEYSGNSFTWQPDYSANAGIYIVRITIDNQMYYSKLIYLQ